MPGLRDDKGVGRRGSKGLGVCPTHPFFDEDFTKNDRNVA